MIDSNIAFGQDLIDNGKIKDGSFLDDVSIQLSGYSDRQNNIQDKLQQLQHRYTILFTLMSELLTPLR